MNIAFLAVVLALFWAVATGNFTLSNLLFGAIVGGIGLFIVRDRVESPRLLHKARRFVALVGLFVFELILSASRVALLVIRPDMRRALRPAIIAFPLTVKSNAEITLLANLITLTPGTLSVDVSEDGKTLYVHALNCIDKESLIRDIARGFETKVAEAFK
jgi:multicomponent Na+:H+ antiporter subunit E